MSYRNTRQRSLAPYEGASLTPFESTRACSVLAVLSSSSKRTVKSECSLAASATTTSAKARNARDSTSCSRMLLRASREQVRRAEEEVQPTLRS